MIEIRGYTNKNAHIINYSRFNFSGGEIQVRINTEIDYPKFHTIVVHAKLPHSEAIMELLMLKNALEGVFGFKVKYELKLGYLPYARQDRICVPGEANASTEMANIINMLYFDTVTILDPHSKAAIEKIYHVKVRTQHDMLVQANVLYNKIVDGSITLVAPDSGATDKVADITDNFIQGHKVRDPLTGKLTNFSFAGGVEGKDLLIVDDICDGGGTFIGLANILYAGGAKSVSLYVTHGIFSKGTNVLYNNGIKHIYTTNSIDNNYENTDKFTKLYWS